MKMKNGIIAILALFLVSLLSMGAFASDLSYDLSEDYFSRSNPYEDGADDEIDHEDDLTYGSVTITVANATSMLLDNVTVDISSYYVEKDMDLDLNADGTLEDDDSVYETTKVTFAADKLSAVVEFIIPQTLDAVKTNGDEDDHSFSVTVDYTNNSVSETETQAIVFKVENALTVKKDIYFTSDSNSAKCDIDDMELDCDDDDLNDFLPGENLYVKLSLENEMSDAEMDEIEIEIDVTNDVDDFNDGKDDIDLDADEVKTFSFLIEPESDSEDIDVGIIVTGEDEFGARHGFFFDINGQVEFNVPEVLMELSANDISSVCTGDYVNVLFDVTNMGADDQDNMIVRVEDTSLGWLKDTARFDLNGEDDGDYESKSFDVTFKVPSTTRVKTYNPRIVLYYEDEDSDTVSLLTSVSVDVIDCDATTDSDDSSDADTGSDNDSTDSQSGITITQPGSTDASIGSTSNLGTSVVTATAKDSNVLPLVGIIALVLLLLIAVIGLVVVLIKK